MTTKDDDDIETQVLLNWGWDRGRDLELELSRKYETVWRRDTAKDAKDDDNISILIL